MKKSKSEAIGNIIIGLIFIAVGAVIFSMDNKEPWVTVIVVADIILGAVLLIGGIIGVTKKEADKPAQDDWAAEWNSDAPAQEEQPEDMGFAPLFDALPEEPAQPAEEPAPAPAPQPSAQEELQRLTAREAELRRLVKQRRADARTAKENAEAAAAAATKAEKKLVAAENVAKQVSPQEKQAILAKIDSLADDAMDKSQQAAIAARRAKAAEKAYADAVAAHREAMDAAADAMMAAEEAELSN